MENTYNKMGVEILNCSPISAIGRFPKVSLEDALAGVACH
jgi:hypothetical protein